MLILTFWVNINLLLGVMPEKIGLFIFGVGLIVAAVILRRIFNRNEREKTDKTIN